MHCHRLDQDRLTSLAAGELPWWKAWPLRRHLRACPDCRAQWEQTQGLWVGLRALASTPAPDTLRSRVFAALPPVTPLAQRRSNTITIGGVTMNRRTLAVTSAALLLVVTGALAARLITFRNSGGFSEGDRHMWNYTSDFKGKMTVFDTQGRLLGEFLNDSGDPVGGGVDLSRDGRHYALRGVGRHDLKDAQGNLIGYAILGPLSTQDTTEMQKEEQDRMPHDFEAAAAWERKQQSAGGGSSGIDGLPTYVAGFDGARKIFWIMRGQGTVHVTPPDGKSITGQGSTMTMTPALRRSLPPEFQFSDEELKTPHFLLSVGDKTTRETGYGEHFIRDATGKTLLILKADPPSQPAPHQ